MKMGNTSYVVNKLINWEQPIQDVNGRLRFETYNSDLTAVNHCGHKVPLSEVCPECQLLSDQFVPLSEVN